MQVSLFPPTADPDAAGHAIQAWVDGASSSSSGGSGSSSSSIVG